MYENMALLSPSMAFGWSRWNSECDDSNTIVVTAVEHVDCEDSVDEHLSTEYCWLENGQNQMELFRKLLVPITFATFSDWIVLCRGFDFSIGVISNARVVHHKTLHSETGDQSTMKPFKISTISPENNSSCIHADKK
ncbi:unnamed protein product [Heterobilharzia americana]|nr:unnamed protein product [Heterobilharzia americana]